MDKKVLIEYFYQKQMDHDFKSLIGQENMFKKAKKGFKKRKHRKCKSALVNPNNEQSCSENCSEVSSNHSIVAAYPFKDDQLVKLMELQTKNKEMFQNVKSRDERK